MSDAATLDPTKAPPTTSLKKRYAAKLATNFIGILTSLGIAVMVPRSLGPAQFGDYNFIFNFFQQLIPFLTLSTSAGFFVKLSQRPEEMGLIKFYAWFTVLACLLMVGFVAVCDALGFGSWFWAVGDFRFVYVGAVFCSLLWIVNLLIQMADAFGLTFHTEKIQISQKVIGIVSVSVLFVSGQLDLASYFSYQVLITALLLGWLITIIYRKSAHLRAVKLREGTSASSWFLSSKEISGYSWEFYQFAKPLFLYALISTVFNIADRALLQKYGGSAEQGYFGLSQSLGNICFVFVSAMTALIMREFSIAARKNDLTEIARLVRRHIPLLYVVAAYFGCFLSMQSDKVPLIFGDVAYKDARLPLMIFALYPIHQTYGTMTGALMMATGQTRLYSILGTIVSLVSFPIAYVALAPTHQFGFDGGAVGLAIKLVVCQFIGANIHFAFIARFLKINFWRYFGHQLGTLVIMMSAAFAVHELVDALLWPAGPILGQFLLAGVIYSLLVGLILLCPFLPLGVYPVIKPLLARLGR